MNTLKATLKTSGNISGKLNTTNNDYDTLKNKPSIEAVVLEGNKTFAQLGLGRITNVEIENILGG